MTNAISPRHLARRAHRAFCEGDLADLCELKDALACGNFRDSGEYRKFVARIFRGLAPEALSKLPIESARIAAEDHCLGASSECSGRIFYWTETNDWEGELPDRPGSSWHRDPIRKQLIAKANNWLQGKKRVVIWLSDFAGNDLPGLSAKELMADLGRFDAQANKRRRIVIFSIRVNAEHQRVYKPTMADSGFAFYWRAWPGSPDHGMTRSLRDNRAAYREWIVRKADVEIIDAWPLPAADVSLSESDLDGTFWQACKDEIRNKRTQLGL